ncbi:MAG: EAL domain-containing protein [Gammaproteobacteria bacterium]|nr:EAL domain-containing protein [Gammaproteobacteria bacterium]
MFRSVRTKIVVIVGAVVLLALLLNTGLGVVAFRHYYTRALEAQASAVGRNLVAQLAQLVRLGIPVDELSGFDQQCRDAVDSYDEVDYAMVLSQDGRVLFHNRTEMQGREVRDAEILAALASGREQILQLAGPGDGRIDVLVPLVDLTGDPLVTVRVGIKAHAISSKVQTLVRSATLMAVASVLAAIALLVIVIGRVILRPLGHLDGAIERLGSSSTTLEQSVQVDSNDEFGNIARAFNRMIDALRESRGEIERYTRELERKVDERTRELKAANAMLTEDIDKRKRVEAQLQQMAYQDTLTGLPNRAFITEHLGERTGDSRWRHDRFAVFFLDLDRFKYINDTFGHATGDALLIEAARRLRASVRRDDVVARLGGDEFVIVLNDVDTEESAAQVATSIIDNLTRPLNLKGHELVVTTSIGIALHPLHGRNGDDLLKFADSAMYLAKSQGRNRYQIYTEALTDESRERLTLESALRRALEQGELEVHYQPRVAMSDSSLVGVEALVRWRHPERGLLTPDTFLAVAGETDLIVAIGEWVLDQSCRAAARWQSSLGRPVAVSVNIAERQVMAGTLVQRVASALERSGLAAWQLELELSEQCVMADTEIASHTLSALHELGVRIAVDDFGTGYSSLNRLKQLPLHGLKVDGVFVRDLPDDPEGAAIAGSIVTLGHSLGLYVVAERVETEAQAEFLRSLGCDEGQGFLFARPMPEAELLEHPLFNSGLASGWRSLSMLAR